MKDSLGNFVEIFAFPRWCNVTSDCEDGEEFGSSSVVGGRAVGTIVEETTEAL